MKGQKAAFSSQSVDWATPRGVYEELDREFHFDFDPCPLGGGMEAMGELPIITSWEGRRVFCNPPYGPQLVPFLRRAKDAALAVYLIPARTDTRWFHDHVLPAASEVRFIRGRLKFGDAKNSAPFPSMIAVYRNE